MMEPWLMQSLFAVALQGFGVDMTWLELLACAFGLLMVLFTLRENHWGWLMAILSSLLYALLFWHHRLYGDAGLQIVFVLLAAWGWWTWLHPDAAPRGAGAPVLPIQMLGPVGRRRTLLAIGGLWPLTGLFLLLCTDTDVPWWDAFPTAASLVGQWLLMRKYCENWLVWLAVNAVSLLLFAYKGLWPTTLLYLVFFGLSLSGWRTWQARMRARRTATSPP